MDGSSSTPSQPLVTKPLTRAPDGLLEEITTGNQLSPVQTNLKGNSTGVVSPAVIFGIRDNSVEPISIESWSTAFTRIEGNAARVAGRADDISTDHAPMWFVNFPPALSESEKEILARYMQEVLAFRCWSSLKCWAYVFDTIPSDGTARRKIIQSSEFAKTTFRELIKTPWLHPIKGPTEFSEVFTCRTPNLHDLLISKALSSFKSLDREVMDALKPVLEGIVSSISDSTTSYNDVRSVLTERYEYVNYAQRFHSYLRLLCFEVSESAWEVHDGKNSSHREIQCRLEYLHYEAEFSMDEWKEHSATLNEEQKTACKDFVKRQTVDISP